MINVITIIKMRLHVQFVHLIQNITGNIFRQAVVSNSLLHRETQHPGRTLSFMLRKHCYTK